MRCFLAIDLNYECRDYLFNLQKEISKFVKAKWVEKKNLHLTLKFIREIDEDKLENVKRILSELKIKKFKIYLNEIGVFPSKDIINVIWIGLKPEKDIISLQKNVDESLLGLFPQDQKFSSHITLGRVKFVKNKDEFKEILKETEIKKIEFEVNSFRLYKSELTKDGPKYYLLEEFKLA